MAEPAALSEPDSGSAGLAVSLRGVTKVYDNGVSALGPFDLDVGKGEFVSPAGAFGLRQVDGAAPDCGIERADVGRRACLPACRQGARRPFDRLCVSGADVDALDQRAENVRLPLKIAHVAAADANAAHRSGAGANGACGIR